VLRDFRERLETPICSLAELTKTRPSLVLLEK
jgi:hypothetical protein